MTTKIEDVDNNLPLPSEKMPKCWNEEERISALFSPFRTKSANPQDWVSKYNFWQNLIYEWLKYTKRNSFSIADLNGAFRRKGCTPLCLVTVVEELHRNNEIIPETEFLKEPCESWTAWSIDTFVKKPLVWSFSKVRSYVVNNEINKETRYILSILERKKESILIPFSELVKSCKSCIDKNILDNTIMLILIWLMREKKVVFRSDENQSELLIKIAAHSSDSITEIEEGLYKLIKQENILIKEIELMEEEKVNIISEAKSYVTKGLRQVAKTYLRKKKELESTIEKRAQTLNNIQSLITSIQDTHTNTTVISTYKIGSDVLKKLNSSCLSESNVKDIVDDLSEALEEQKEVQCILSESLKNDDSNVDLEKELAELMELDENILPSVPNTKLNSTIDELQKNLKNLHVEDATVSHVSSKLPKKANNEKISKQYECV